MNRDFIKDVLFGVAVGDAIGVPVEFKTRQSLLCWPDGRTLKTWADGSEKN